jgi:hypothetical protein
VSGPRGSAARRQADGIPRLQLGIPVYADPDVVPEIWAGALSCPRGSTVIVNPDSGSGRAHDARYAERVARAHQRGLEVLGYVDTAYGARPAAAVVDDVVQHVSWYGIDGVFLDQVPGGPAHLDYYRSLAGAIRSRGLSVALNMGMPDVHRGYAEIADLLGVFEGTPEAYATASFPSWMSDAGRQARLWHLIFDVPDERGMREMLALAVTRPCELVFVTDGRGPNPWDRLPSYWASEVTAV